MTGRFHYRAATAEGQVVEGVIQATSRQTVLDGLRRQRLYPVAVDEAPAAGAAPLGRRLNKRAAVALWTRNVAILLGAGVSVDRALAFTAQQSGHEGLTAALRDVRRAVQGGKTLADALRVERGYFDPLFVAMVAAGEASGALEPVFERLSEQLEEGTELRAQVRAALLYPALMAVVACVGVGVLMGFVIPRFAAVLSDVGGTLPLSTRLLLGASAILVRFWWLWLLLVAGGAYTVWEALAQPAMRRRWHEVRLRWPWVGDIELKYATARFARTLGLLLKSGVPMLPALTIARASAANLVLREGLERATAQVAEGGALAPALGGTLPPLALQMIAVGEESGRLEDLCARIADTYEQEVRRAVRTAMTLLEPVLILGFGALVGSIALAMLQAIYGINLNAF